MKRKFLFLMCFFLLSGFAFWSIDGYLYKNSLSSHTDCTTTEDFVVEKGELPKSIANRLQEKHIISSSRYFLRYANEKGLSSNFQAGQYSFCCSSGATCENTLPQIAEALTHAKPIEQKVTIPEGFTLQEMDDLFFKKGILKKGEFLSCVATECDFSKYSFLPASRKEYEGYFFPATYIFSTATSGQEISEKMLQAFGDRAEKLGLFQKGSKRTLSQVVIMASIIEREWGKSNEGTIISGILWNRIDQGIPLGADATLRYAKALWNTPLTANDLDSENPFNTRNRRGLPPTAISAPGEAALLAAKNPAKTEYLYYLHDQSGKIHYAKTNDEHNKNKQTFCGGSCE